MNMDPKPSNQPIVEGLCRLCLRQRELRNSHVWPSFLYKRYISDQTRGGRFVDVSGDNPAAKLQLKKRWLCDECEGIFQKSETAIAKFLRDMEAAPKKQHAYNDHLLRFSVSMSWRITLNRYDHLDGEFMEDRIPAMKCWREFLRYERTDIRNNSQHVFSIFDPVGGMHKILTGCVYRQQGVVVTQAGPLMIAGLLEVANIGLRDQTIWEASRVNDCGGTLSVVGTWRVGRNVTLDFCRLLASQEGSMRDAVQRMARERGMRF